MNTMRGSKFSNLPSKAFLSGVFGGPTCKSIMVDNFFNLSILLSRSGLELVVLDGSPVGNEALEALDVEPAVFVALSLASNRLILSCGMK